VALGLRTALLTTLALLAFAGNSLLAREALARHTIDAASFAAIRLFAGALVLAMLARRGSGSWRTLRPRGFGGPLALFLYALPFSLAYMRIGAATGALVLFGCVQLTMLACALWRGERPRPLAWCGFATAAGGLVWLVAPAASRPDVLGVVEMAIAGIAWGAYTMLGRAAGEPIAANARSFVYATPIALLFCIVEADPATATTRGIALAAISGAITSGLGYAIWYRVLPHLSVARAAFAQLAVPAIAALGAVALLGEALTVHLAVASALVLGGVAAALADRERPGRLR
jgi:drug/metabolite transporter (DMT)-like permease